jgi:hypothetical protein
MDIPIEAIDELRGIGRDLILDIPDWVGGDAEPKDLDASPANQGSDHPSAKKP